MATVTIETPIDPHARKTTGVRSPAAEVSAVSTAAHQVFWILRIGFAVAPILAGIDKFFNWSVQWPNYLAGWINDIMPGTGQEFMYVIGGVEILAGLAVLFAPRVGALFVAVWLAAITVNLLTVNPPEFYDIALRDFGLMLGALALWRLALAVAPARRDRTLPSRPW